MGNWFFKQWQISRTWFQTELKLPNAFCTVWENCAALAIFEGHDAPKYKDIILLLISLGSPKQTQKMNGGKECGRRGQGWRSSSYTSSCGLAASRWIKMEALHQVSPSCYLHYLQVCSHQIKKYSLFLWERKILWLVAPQINLNKWSLCWKY